MSLLVFLIVGALVGWIASQIMGRNEGLLMSIVIGVVGSFIGSFISTFFTGADQSYLSFGWVGFAWSLVGAIVLVAILNAFSSRTHHNQV